MGGIRKQCAERANEHWIRIYGNGFRHHPGL